MLTLTLLTLLGAPKQVSLEAFEVSGPPGASAYSLLSGGKVLAHEVKWRLSQPLTLTGLRITTCDVSQASFSLVAGTDSADSADDGTRRSRTIELRVQPSSEAKAGTLTITPPDDAGVEDVCLAKLELLGQGGKPIALTVPPRDLALAEAVAKCERDVAAHSAFPRPTSFERCEVSSAEVKVPGHDLVRVDGSFTSDGEGSFRTTEYLLLHGDTVTSVLALSSTHSGDGPGSAHSEELLLCRQKTNGVQVFEVHSTDASWDVDAQGDWKHTGATRITRYVWTGSAFDEAPVDKPCPPPLKPRPPAWLKRATASSQLVEKGLPADFYAPVAAVDSLTETAWAEGVRGPGTGESLTLELQTPMSLKALRVQGGCGTTPAVWKQNERVKALTVTFGDGAQETFELPDAKLGEWRRVDLARTAPTASVKLTIDAVYPARFQDACFTEVQIEAR